MAKQGGRQATFSTSFAEQFRTIRFSGIILSVWNGKNKYFSSVCWGMLSHNHIWNVIGSRAINEAKDSMSTAS
jgi:hypothetical protein